jgi:hypothetical protein
MDKSIIFFVFGLLLLGGIFATVYFFYEKPTQDSGKTEYYNITIRTFDRDSNKQISTGIYITLDESTNIYYNGSTLKDGYSFVQIPKNRTFTIFNHNLEEQNNYINYIKNDDLTKDIIRFDMPIYNISGIELQTLGSLGVDNPIFIKIDSNGTFTNMHFCFSWSPRIIKVFINNSEELPIPKRLEKKVSRCFKTENKLDHNYVVIPIQYTKFGTITEMDYINVYVLDSDIVYQDRTSLTTPKVSDLSGNDVGGKDILYIIKNI